jgi:hypothetical protein
MERNSMREQRMQHSVQSSNLADLLERVLDKGIVVAGDIKIKIVDIELLTIQIRLMIASVDKAREMGMDWWSNNPDFNSKARAEEVTELRARLAALEAQVAKAAPPPGA